MYGMSLLQVAYDKDQNGGLVTMVIKLSSST